MLNTAWKVTQLNSHIGNLMAAKDWLPSLLTQFMQHVVSSELKHVALSHCIVQAARPRSVISPVLLAVGVSMDHVFGSRWLIETLARLGVSVSYDEVYLFKQSCVQSADVDKQQLLTDAFVQWSADNIDHSI
jgi:hypothetical protein